MSDSIDANKVIDKLTEKIALLERLNAMLQVHNEELVKKLDDVKEPDKK